MVQLDGRVIVAHNAAYDIDLIGAHRASVEAYATAYRWPSLPSSARPWYARPDFAAEQTASAFLERISVRLPEITGPAKQQDYRAARPLPARPAALHPRSRGALIRQNPP